MSTKNKRILIKPYHSFFECTIHARSKLKNTSITELSDLKYAVQFYGEISQHNLTFDEVQDLEAFINSMYFVMYGKTEHYGPSIKDKLINAFHVDKINIQIVEGEYHFDEILEAQETSCIPQTWKTESQTFIMETFTLYGRILSHCFIDRLGAFLRTQRQFEITDHSIEIKFLDSFYTVLSTPDNVFRKDSVHEFAYHILGSNANQFYDLNKFALQLFLNGFQLNVNEIVFNFQNVNIQCRSLSKLKSDCYRITRRIRNKDMKIFVTPSYIFDLERTSNFARVLHEINWSDYLAADEATSLFEAYDNLQVFTKNPKSHLKLRGALYKSKKILVKCFNAEIEYGTDPRESLRQFTYDIRVFKTKFKSQHFDFLVYLINALLNVGDIIFNYSNVNFASDENKNKIKAQVYELRSAIKNKTANIHLKPFDFYKSDKNIKFELILSDALLDQFLPIKDVLSLNLAFPTSVRTSDYKKQFILWTNNNQKTLSDIRVHFGSVITIVGNDNFYYQYDKIYKSLEFLKNMFNYFASSIDRIVLTIQTWPISNESISMKREWFTNIHYVIIKSCTNLSSFVVSSTDDEWFDNEELVVFKPLDENYTTIGNFDDVLESRLKLDVHRDLIERVDLKTEKNANAITEQIFETVLKLPKLNELNLTLPYPSFVNWKFLESIKCWNHEIIFSHLQYFQIINRTNNRRYGIDEFLDSLLKILSSSVEIKILTLNNFYVTPRTFNVIPKKLFCLELLSCVPFIIEESDLFKPKINITELVLRDMVAPIWIFCNIYNDLKRLKFINCTIYDNVLLQKDFCLTEIAFCDQIVPTWIFTSLYDIENLHLDNCSNVTNECLDLILSRTPKLKSIHIENCPITDAILYSYISSRVGLGDIDNRDQNYPLAFQLYDLPQCSQHVIDFISGHNFPAHDCLFPRVVKTTDYIYIKSHPYLQKLYNPSDIALSFADLEDFCDYYLHQRFASLFTNITIRIDLGHYHIVADNDFIIPLGVQSLDVDNKLEKIFQYFGMNIRSIQVIIANYWLKHYLVPRASLLFQKLVNTFIQPNCANVTTIKYGCNAEILKPYEDLLILCPFLKQINYQPFAATTFEIHHLDEHNALMQFEEMKHVASYFNLNRIYGENIKEIYEKILKLPWLIELDISLSCLKAVDWDFLGKVKCTENERILPRLQNLRISSDVIEPTTAVEDFCVNLLKIIKNPLTIAKLEFFQFEITNKTFENCCFRPESMKFYKCSFEDDLIMEEFSFFYKMIALDFQRMDISPLFFHTTNADAPKLKEFYLALLECPTLNDDDLDLIIKSNSPILTFNIYSSPMISADFLAKRPNVRGKWTGAD